MLVVGLTGGIATGKSTVSALLHERYPHIPIIDADVIAREVVEPGRPALREIERVFGPEVILPSGALNRPALGSIIFSDPYKRAQLNAITHPRVRWEILRRVLVHWVRGERYVVLDVPLLIEGLLWVFVGLVVVVYCSEETQLKRLQARDASAREAAQARISAQMPISRKLAYADVVIDNSAPLPCASPSSPTTPTPNTPTSPSTNTPPTSSPSSAQKNTPTSTPLTSQIDALVRHMDAKTGRVWWRISWLVPPFALLSALGTVLVRQWKVRRRLRGEGKREGKGKRD